MVKHLLSEKEAGKNVIHGSKTYRSIGRVVYLPEAVEMYNPVIEEVKEEVADDKDELVEQAHKLGLGSPSTLKRLSPETLKKRIEEA